MCHSFPLHVWQCAHGVCHVLSWHCRPSPHHHLSGCRDWLLLWKAGGVMCRASHWALLQRTEASYFFSGFFIPSHSLLSWTGRLVFIVLFMAIVFTQHSLINWGFGTSFCYTFSHYLLASYFTAAKKQYASLFALFRSVSTWVKALEVQVIVMWWGQRWRQTLNAQVVSGMLVSILDCVQLLNAGYFWYFYIQTLSQNVLQKCIANFLVILDFRGVFLGHSLQKF